MDSEAYFSNRISLIESGSFLQLPKNYQVLYKYVGLDTNYSWELFERLVAKSEMVGSPSVNLNDPFELSPFIVNDINERNILNFIEGRPSRATAILQGLDIDQFARREFNKLGDFLSAIGHSSNELVGQSRIISFSARSNSPLMWSHYANKHRGACLHFMARGLRSRFSDNSIIGKVIYEEERPAIPASLLVRYFNKSRQSLVSREEFQLMIYFIKSIDWSYEEEFRLVYDSDKSDSVRMIDSDFIGISFGINVSDKTIERVSSILENNGRSDIRLYRAKISNRSYLVDIDFNTVIDSKNRNL